MQPERVPLVLNSALRREQPEAADTTGLGSESNACAGPASAALAEATRARLRRRAPPPDMLRAPLRIYFYLGSPAALEAELASEGCALGFRGEEEELPPSAAEGRAEARQHVWEGTAGELLAQLRVDLSPLALQLRDVLARCSALAAEERPPQQAAWRSCWRACPSVARGRLPRVHLWHAVEPRAGPAVEDGGDEDPARSYTAQTLTMLAALLNGQGEQVREALLEGDLLRLISLAHALGVAPRATLRLAALRRELAQDPRWHPLVAPGMRGARAQARPETKRVGAGC
jgi:hypothetical protein